MRAPYENVCEGVRERTGSTMGGGVGGRGVKKGEAFSFKLEPEDR